MGVLGFMVFGGCYLFLGIMIKKYYIHNVERLEAHTTVNIVQNNVLNVAPVQACEEAEACAGERRPMSERSGACAAEGSGVCEAERLPAFEEAVPEYLRTGKLFRAWEGLRKAGLLTETYRLAEGVPHAAAHHIAWCFGQKRAELMGSARACTDWRYFERLWQIESLKTKKSRLSRETAATIDKIFSNL